MSKRANTLSGGTFSWLQMWAYWKQLENDKQYKVMKEIWFGIGHEKGGGDGGLKCILIDSVLTFPCSVLNEMFIGCPDDVLSLVRREVPENMRHLVKYDTDTQDKQNPFMSTKTKPTKERTLGSLLAEIRL